MIFARINLENTNYNLLPNGMFINGKTYLNQIKNLYYDYCDYKEFPSVMPLFDSEIVAKNVHIMGYFSGSKLIAFTLLKILDNHNIENVQFAWDYKEPKLRLGIESLKHECCFYKNLGYKFMYIGATQEYKKSISGYEEIGKYERH